MVTKLYFLFPETSFRTSGCVGNKTARKEPKEPTSLLPSVQLGRAITPTELSRLLRPTVQIRGICTISSYIIIK